MFDFFVAVSYTGLNKLRRARVDAAEAKGYTLVHYVSRHATRFSTFAPQPNQLILEDNTIQTALVGRDARSWHSAVETALASSAAGPVVIRAVHAA
jgi:hypothetical protein